jgi:AcrR family transcriptional regulator
MAPARAAATRTTASANGEADNPFRRRLLGAMAAEIAERGYPNTTVADVVRRAQTSRRTFYEYFADREACYVALLIEHNAIMVREILAAVDGDAHWHTQIEQAIETWIAVGEANPALLLSWIRDAPSLGATAHDMQTRFTNAFVDMVLRMCNTKKLRAVGVGPISRQRAVVLMGGLRELTATAVENGGRVTDIRREAIDAAAALLGPGTQPPRPVGSRKKAVPRRG